MYTEHHPCWDAKNRHGLPSELPFTFSSIAHCIPEMMGGVPKATPPTSEKPRQPQPEENHYHTERAGDKELHPSPEVADRGRGTLPNEGKASPENSEAAQGIPKKLLDLMNSYHVVIEDVTGAVEKRGYYPKGTPIKNYDPAFVEGVLVAAWPKVYEMILENKRAAGEFINIPDGTEDELPFD